MAVVFDTQGQYDMAAEYYEKCLAITLKLPDRDNLREAEALTGLGNVYLKQGKYREALKELERSVATKVALPSFGAPLTSFACFDSKNIRTLSLSG